jgi:benzoate transport
MSTDVVTLLRHRPMSAVQVLAVALCTVINGVDGFDILAAAFTAPQIAREWSLQPTQLGLLFSSGLAGMTLGALALSPIADFWGRRRTVLLSLVLITTGMLGSAAAANVELLMAARVLTGIGVGAMMPTINTVVAEFSNDRRRDLAVSLQGAGFPLGGTLGGLGVYLLADLSWRWVFVAGGVFSLLLIVPVLPWMPESMDFLIARRPPRALEKLNGLLDRIGLARLDALPAAPPRHREHAARGARPSGLRLNTLLICSSFFLLMFTFYFLTNWTPKLLTDYGLSTRVGISGAVLMNLGGFIGDLVFSALMLRWPASRTGPFFMMLCFITAFVFAFIPMKISLLMPLALLMGFLLFGSMLSLYAIVPTIFPASVRTTGTGFALGLGRIGATVGPYVGGVLIAIGWERASYVLIMSAPLLLCALLTRSLSRRTATPAIAPQPSTQPSHSISSC